MLRHPHEFATVIPAIATLADQEGERSADASFPI